MRQRIVGMCAVVIALACGEVEAMPITYELSFDGGGGNTISGTITLAEGVTGPVSPSDFTAWSFTAVGVPAFTISSASPFSDVECGVGGCFTATPTSLFFTFGVTDASFRFVDNDLQWSLQTDDSGGEVLSVKFGWPAKENKVQSFVPGTTLIGSAVPGSVPEPGVIALLGVALAAGFGVAHQRIRGQHSPPV